jgi:predicted metal-binding membrane protein
LAGISALAWAYLLHDSQCGTDAVCGIAPAPQSRRWLPLDQAALFTMWAIMMAAMMIPSVVPSVLLFAKLSAARRQDGRPFVSAGIFLAGYLLAWTAFSAAATGAQSMLHSAAVLSSGMKSVRPGFAAGVLLSAGVFQFLPFRSRCLAHCQSPIQFFAAHWREGVGGALNMGVRHGLHCVGCCWLLMCVLFVTGVMNISWVAAITVVVILEKVVPARFRLDRIVGVGLVGWGVAVGAKAFL